MSDKDELTVFVDGMGRTIVGELNSETKLSLKVKNPSVIHVQPNPQSGQIQVQLLPFFFKEFSKQGTGEDATWEFLKANVVRASGLELDDRLKLQYKNMYSVIQQPVAPVSVGTEPAGDATPVIKLFDD